MGHRTSLIAAAALALLPATAEPTLRVLLLAPDTTPERRQAIARLRDALERTGRFTILLTEDPAASSAAGYDAILVDCFTRLPDAGAWKAVVTMRAARCAGAPSGETRELNVAWSQTEHPVAAGLAQHFRTADAPGPIAAGESLASAGRQPVVRLRKQGNAAWLETSLGENVAALDEPSFLDIVGRGLEFTATGKVTLKPQTRRHGRLPGAVRALVVTGGHPYDASFYTLLEGNPRIYAQIDPHPRPYRAGDLRKNWDVLVLYDSMQTIDEQERKNLVDFVEAGKGIVFLHHALVDYCNWQWWYEEVMGGRWYQTGDNPPKWKTRWKHDVEQIVRPVAKHPVTEGVGIMHLWDETYQGMWMSPRNQVLMRSDHPTSDGPVVWISPYTKSRVVAIQLGHDRSAHEHPAYRRLVNNAIVWAASGR
ncbi:MAG: ThuA domain-containing protein [Bryobacterales bacterium]|nr:ThuA domain-containing protein [Bryobacterales bacterium]